MKAEFSVVACQMTSVDDLNENLQQIVSLLKQIEVSQHLQLICFPENCLYLRIIEGEKISGITIDDPALAEIAQWAKKLNSVIHLGSVPLKENQKLVNASVTCMPNGSIQVTYRKIHLFDIQLEGQKPIRESDVFEFGETPEVLDLNGVRIGQSICYDLRFSELFLHYFYKKVDLLLVPSAFLVQTGRDHWEILLRARAIENQCYVIAAAQAGKHRATAGGEIRETFGHSLIVDPWGKICQQAKTSGPEVLKVQVDFELINRVRRQIPVSQHRRLQILK